MKKWRCIQVGHHDDVGKVIEEWEQTGWRLHAYTAAGLGSYRQVNHYLLFTREE